jgi:cytochrome d ubiquinol oxidase subunit II
MRPIYTGGFFNLLHPYALISGVVSLSMLVMHGATYAALKTSDPMGRRARTVARTAALVFVAAFLLAGVWSSLWLDGHRIVGAFDPAGPSDPLRKQVEVIAGGWLGNYSAHPVLCLAPVLALASAGTVWLLLRSGSAGVAFIFSSLAQAGTILTAGIALFPFLMPSSSTPSQGLTVWDASSSQTTLTTMVVAVVIFLPIVLAYTIFAFRVMRGKVTLEQVRAHGDGY